jgi:dihydropteroate synthase
MRMGVRRDQIVVDPGLGFGKDVSQNLELIAGIEAFEDLGAGVVSAASRKSFVGKITGVARPADRLSGTLAVSMRHWLAGVRLFRVHDVAAHVQAFAMLDALERGGVNSGVDDRGQ